MLLLAYLDYRGGETAVWVWLLISFTALQVSTAARHQMERGRLLDFRDDLLDAAALKDLELDKQTKGAVQMQQRIESMVKEAEKRPEILEVIQLERPNHAWAIQAILAEQSRNAAQNGGSQSI